MPEQTIPDGVIAAARRMAPRAARCEPVDFQRAVEMAYLAGCLDQQRTDRVETNGVRKQLAEAQVTIRAFVEPGGQWETEYGNGQWDCWGNAGEGYEPDTYTRRVFYGPAVPIKPGETS